MQITLKQRDVELALKMYLSSQGIPLAGRSFDLDFTAGRKDTGLTIYVDIGSAEELTQSFVNAVQPAEPRPVTQKVFLDPEVESAVYSQENEEAIELEVTQATVQSSDFPSVPPVSITVVREKEAALPQAEAVPDPAIPVFWVVDEPEPVVEAAKPEVKLAPAAAPAKVSLFA